MLGLPTNKAAAWHAGVDGIGGVFWEMYVVEKQKSFQNFYELIHQQQIHRPADEKRVPFCEGAFWVDEKF